MDTLTPEERSLRMSLVRNKNSSAEMLVRNLIHSLGHRYRLHCKDLPGKPDLIFRKKRRIIFVHGCFWHRHRAKTCKLARMPKSRLDFWLPKLEGNRLRDAKVKHLLIRDGWKVLTIWECEIAKRDKLTNRVQKFLSSERLSSRTGNPRSLDT